MKNEKYVVFKADDWAYFMEQEGSMLSIAEPPQPLDDAVVIRTQDMFAAAGLSAYAHNIRLAMELWRGDGQYAPSSILDLRDTADYFMDCSREAEDRLARGDCKLPD